MAEIKIQKIATSVDRSLPVFSEVDHVMQNVQQRAFELFTSRGGIGGDALADWLTAEHELCWPAAELLESEGNLIVNVALPGYRSEEIWVTAAPREIVVQAKSTKKRGAAAHTVCWSEIRNDEVCRRIVLPDAIDVDKCYASLENGVLRITAAAVKSAEWQVSKSIAA